MESSNLVGYWCAIMTTVQGVAACFALADRRVKVAAENGGVVTPKSYPLATSVLLFGGSALTLAFGCWMLFAKPLRPKIQVVEKSVYVDRPVTVPCPPSRTGSSSNRGSNGFANSGSIGSVKQGYPPKKD